MTRRRESRGLFVFVLAALLPGMAGPVAAQTERPAPARAGDYVLSFQLPEGGGPGLGFGAMMSDRTRLAVFLQGDWEREEVESAVEERRETLWRVGFGPELRIYGLQTVRRVAPFFHLAASGGYEEHGGGVRHRRAAAEMGFGAEWFPLRTLGISGQTGLGFGWSRGSRTPGAPGAVDEELRSVGFGFFRSGLSLNLYF